MGSVKHGATLWKDIKRIFNEGTGTSQSDEELLERFASFRDEVAFVDLVARYGHMVLTASRSVLRDQNDVEDAFQATFLVLVRRAGSIRQGESLGAWLHRVAVRVALEANRVSVRKRADERKAMERLTIRVQVDKDQEDWLPVLHQELERLSGRYRLPIVLCHLQNLTQAQAAAELRLSVGTLRRRLAKGRKLLRDRLSKRGVGLAGCISGLLLARSVEAAVSRDWIDSTTKAAKRIAAGTGSATAAALAEGVQRAMFLTRLKLTTAALAVAAVTAVTFAVVMPGAGGGVEPPIIKQSSAASSPGAIEPLLDTPPGGNSIVPAKLPETSSVKVWATISARWPIERQGKATKPIPVYFGLMSDGERSLAAKIKSSKLFINGKAYKDWPNIVSDVGYTGAGSRVHRFDTLRPDEGIVFGHNFEDAFSNPGIYRVQWEGDGFRSPEIMFRVVPKKEGG